MIGKVEQRRQERTAEIVAVAWKVAAEEGIGGVTLRELARQVGMRQPSLYEYFESKHALYDAMFADGNQRLLERIEAVELSDDPRAALKAWMRAFVEFVLEDQARLQLLFQRPIPGFEPSAESFAIAEQVLGRSVALIAATGMDDPDDIDCFVAMIGGVIAAQSSNEPGGDRWSRHLERLIDLHLDDAARRHAETRSRTRKPKGRKSR
jgi:AcrR family transcriptional regulator